MNGTSLAQSLKLYSHISSLSPLLICSLRLLSIIDWLWSSIFEMSNIFVLCPQFLQIFLHNKACPKTVGFISNTNMFCLYFILGTTQFKLHRFQLASFLLCFQLTQARSVATCYWISNMLQGWQLWISQVDNFIHFTWHTSNEPWDLQKKTHRNLP